MFPPCSAKVEVETVCILLADVVAPVAARSRGRAAVMSPSSSPTMSSPCSRRSLPTYPVTVSLDRPLVVVPNLGLR